MRLRAVSPEARSCKICGGAAHLFGVVDFNRSCEELRGKYLAASGAPIYYRRCTACNFLFTDLFDDWSHTEFNRNIYNEKYAEVDPDYISVRPLANAELIEGMF